MIRKKRKFFSPIGFFRPTCNGMCLTDHADGDIVHISYSLTSFFSKFLVLSVFIHHKSHFEMPLKVTINNSKLNFDLSVS